MAVDAEQLCPQLFGSSSAASTWPRRTAPQERRGVCGAAEGAAHARLMEAHARVAGALARGRSGTTTSTTTNKDGESCKAFHPEQLAKRQELLPIQAFGSEDDDLKGAQGTASLLLDRTPCFSSIVRVLYTMVRVTRCCLVVLG